MAFRANFRVVSAFGAVLAVTALLVTAPQAFALSKHVFSTSFSGSGATALSDPSDVAVDQATHDVYVTDPANFRVEKFDSSGNFILMFGKEVDKTKTEEFKEPGNPHGITEAEENLCTAASGDVCQPGTKGSSAGAFNTEIAPNIFEPERFDKRLFLAVDNTPEGGGDVYVGDPGDRLVQKFNQAGELITSWGAGGALDGSTAVGGVGQNGPFVKLFGIAVDPTTGDLEVRGEPVYQSELFKFSRSGTFIADPFLTALHNLGDWWAGISVDSSGDVYLGGGQAGGAEAEAFGTNEIRVATPGLSEAGLVASLEGTGGIGNDQVISGLGVEGSTHELFFTTTHGTHGTVRHLPTSCIPTPINSIHSYEKISCAIFETFGGGELNAPKGVAIDESTGTVYVADSGNHRIAVYSAEPYLPDATTAPATPDTTTSETLSGEVLPAGAGEVTGCHFLYVTDAAFQETHFADLSSGGSVPCSSTHASSNTPVTAELIGLTYGTAYHFQLVVENANGSNASVQREFETLPEAPQLSGELATAIRADAALIHATINPGGGGVAYPTTFHVQYGETESYGSLAPVPDAEVGSARANREVSFQLSRLNPGTTYHYRVVASNASGTVTGPDKNFTTFPYVANYVDGCPNSHVRQQTGASFLADCRAYELVSASNAGGYDVESNLIPGQEPFGSYPQANGRVLYGVHDGGIPNTGESTNRGVDPYVATRGEHGWSTKYVGIPANGTPSTSPFSSALAEADAGLETFAFGGPEICSPCFQDGSTGNPIHLPSGELTQGMAGSIPQPAAKPAGFIGRHLSADGTHFVFGSKSKLEPDANEGEISIYDRNLTTGETHVVSKTPTEQTMEEEGKEIGELDISNNGSHILIGHLVEEKEGAKYWHLYMNVGDSSKTIDLTPAATKGVLFDGMTEDGSKVFFSSEEHLTGEDEQHTGADIFMWEEATNSLTLISKGNGNSCEPVANSAHEHWNTTGSQKTCGVVAVGGGGGVSSANGTIYFLSPEKLAGSGNGTLNAPNLYRAGPADSYAPHFVATLESVLSGPQPPTLSRAFSQTFGSFSQATGLAVDHSNGDVYVLDAEAQTVEKFDGSGHLITSFGDSTPTPDGRLTGTETPAGHFEVLPEFSSELAVDQSTGDFYVPDFGDGVVDKFSSSGHFIEAIEVSLPSSVAVDPSNGDVYVTQILDFNTFTPHVSVFTAAGAPVPAASFETTAGLPVAIAVDGANGDVYVNQGEEEEAHVEKYDSSGSPLGTLDPNRARSLAFDPSTRAVFADEGGRVAEYGSNGQLLGTVGAGHLTESAGVAIDPEGTLFASDGTNVAAFGASLVSSEAIDNRLVVDSVTAPETRHTSDFQVTPNGNYAAFPSTLALAGNGEETAGHPQIYRYGAAAGEISCASCTPTGEPSSSDASLAPDGLSLTNDGRVFFTTADQLATFDTDNKKDAYEWEENGAGNCRPGTPSFDVRLGACLSLISTGTSAFQSGLLGVSADGTDAYFFTRDSLVPSDENGPTMKIYDAREEGGFPYLLPREGCKASDECHGAGSPQPPPIEAGSEAGTPHNYHGEEPEKPKPCRKGYVRKHGHCVKKHSTKHHRRAKHHRGGRK